MSLDIVAMNLANRFALFLIFLGAPVWAAQPAEVEYMVRQVLEQQGALYVTYNIDGNGKVSVLFGANEPDWRIKKTVEALQSRPDIPPGLFWVKTDTELCAIR
jgi:hypothetical protein